MYDNMNKYLNSHINWEDAEKRRTEAFTKGKEEGFKLGFKDGFKDGCSKDYNDGYNQAIKDMQGYCERLASGE